MKIPYSRRTKGLATLLGVVLAAGSVVSGFRPLPDPTLLVRRLAEFYTSTQPEISYLHLDQAAYVAGETLWFKAYLLDARAHQPDSLSRVLYVDVVAPDRQVLFQRTLSLTAGQAAGDIILPDTLQSGVYTVRAYTSWMRNSDEGLFFSRRVSVWQASAPVTGSTPSAAREAQLARRTARAVAAATRPDVQFFPEGGDYVAGLLTTVGVKAMQADGHGLALTGVVVDGTKREVVRFQTPPLGMSSFGFTPEPGEQYEARVTLPDGSMARYPLPVVRASGWVLNVREIGDEFRVFARYQPPAGAVAAVPVPLQLLAHVRGQPVYAGQGQIRPGETFQATIAKSAAPAGLLHITLFDGQQVAQAERLVFVPETKPLQVRLRPDKTTYGPRELVTLDVEVNTSDGRPAPAELSVAVAGTPGLPTEAGDATTVRAHLLLTSELRGYVENPGYYFQPRTTEIQQAQNDLLLTQGWSRFTWQQVLAEPGTVAAGYRFPLERTLTLGGRLVRANDKPVPNGELTILLGKQKDVVLSQADANGNFLFTGLPGLDSTKLLVQARTAKGSSNVLVRLNEWWPRPAPAGWHPPAPLSQAVLTSAPVVAYGQLSRRQQQLERVYRPDSTSGIVLRNVDIKGQKAPENDAFSLHGGMADAVLRTSDIPGAVSFRNVFELIQGRVAGIFIAGQGSSYNVQIRGVSSIGLSSQPLYILDGMPLSDAGALLSVPVADIERVEVLKGPSAAIYGVRGANGVIAVYTKRGPNDNSAIPAAGVAVRRVPAYHRTREFYAPRYDTGREANKPDPRVTTLYWQPRLTVPASGRARVSFYTADQAGAFRASVEGVSLAGQPATAEATLAVTAQP